MQKNPKEVEVDLKNPKLKKQAPEQILAKREVEVDQGKLKKLQIKHQKNQKEEEVDLRKINKDNFMKKNSWTTVDDAITAKLYAHNKVEWEDNYGKTKSGKVKQIISDYVSIIGDDGSTHILRTSQVRKKINL